LGSVRQAWEISPVTSEALKKNPKGGGLMGCDPQNVKKQTAQKAVESLPDIEHHISHLEFLPGRNPLSNCSIRLLDVCFTSTKNAGNVRAKHLPWSMDSSKTCHANKCFEDIGK